MGKKKIIIAVIAVVCTLALSGCGLGAYAIAVNYGETVINLDATVKYQTLQGFGASSAWVYQQLGAIDDSQFKDRAMEMLYGDSGLALNTFRYNVGAGGVESDAYEDPLRGAESYFIASRFDKVIANYSVFSDEKNYDFTRDAAVRDMLERALSTENIDKIVFFANSPHYLMTKNGKTHGAKENDNNLKEECYEAFSEYMLVIVNYLYRNLISQYGNDIKILISPVNEPQWKWGGEGATQEGCHYDPKALAKFYDVFYKTLCKYNSQHGTSFEMDIFESGNYQMIKSVNTKFNQYMTEFAKYDYFDKISHISVHSYGADTSEFYRTLFAEYMDKNHPRLDVSVTEYCTMEWGVDTGIDMGLRCGKVIMRDLTMLDAVDWNHWLSIAKGGYEDGLLYWYDNDGVNALDTTKRYYVLGHFSKYTSKGSVRIKAQYSDILGWNGVESAAFANPDGSITLVVINDNDNARKIKIKGGFENVKEIRTDNSVDWQIKEYRNRGKFNLQGKSITTYVFTK